MGRRCPLGGYVLYLDCLECDDKVCKRSSNVNKDYFDKVNEVMCKRGYSLSCIKNPNSESEVRCYSQEPKLDGSENKVIVEVGLGKQFKLCYTNIQMLAKLETNWLSPISSKEYFDKMVSKFLRSVNVLRKEWNDW